MINENTRRQKERWLRISRNIPIGIFLVGWILPLLYFGMINAAPPWLPEFFAKRANISRLFAIEQKMLAVYEIQFLRGNSQTIEVLHEDHYFHMRPFGFRTRMQRALALASESQMNELIGWLKTRLEEQTMGAGVTEMKILVFPYETDERLFIKGRYRQPKSSQANENTVRILKKYDFKNTAGSH